MPLQNNIIFTANRSFVLGEILFLFDLAVAFRRTQPRNLQVRLDLALSHKVQVEKVFCAAQLGK
jgi:hypothetical protein